MGQTCLWCLSGIGDESVREAFQKRTNKMMAKFKNFLKSKDHRLSAGIGVAAAAASLASAGAIFSLMALGSAVVIPALLTLVVSAFALEISFKLAYYGEIPPFDGNKRRPGNGKPSRNTQFKIFTCLGSMAATTGILTLAFNAVFSKAPEQPKADSSRPVALVQEFEKSAAWRNIGTVAAPYKEMARDATMVVISRVGKMEAA